MFFLVNGNHIVYRINIFKANVHVSGLAIILLDHYYYFYTHSMYTFFYQHCKPSEANAHLKTTSCEAGRGTHL
jgi:hypothetical protein